MHHYRLSAGLGVSPSRPRRDERWKDPPPPHTQQPQSRPPHPQEARQPTKLPLHATALKSKSAWITPQGPRQAAHTDRTQPLQPLNQTPPLGRQHREELSRRREGEDIRRRSPGLPSLNKPRLRLAKDARIIFTDLNRGCSLFALLRSTSTKKSPTNTSMPVKT